MATELEIRFRRLREAVRDIYYAAVWHPDRPVPNEQRLWTNLRNAAEFPPGHSPKEIVK